MQINESLLKAHEELLYGLAKDDRLQVDKPTRKNPGGARRMDTFAKLIETLNELSNDHTAAAFKIGLAWKIKDNPAKLKSSMRMWGHIGGGIQDTEAKAAQVLSDFKRWSDFMAIQRKIDHKNIAISICAQGATFAEAARPYYIHAQTAKSKAIDAIEQWVFLENPKPKDTNNTIRNEEQS